MYTKNNHESMKTVVETFVIEETADLIYDNDKLDKWNEHVRDLELSGQAKIVKANKSPIPFMHMKSGMVNIFEVLCPKKVDISEYDKTPIPLQILDLVALSKREGYFQLFQIWYDDKSPDPVCLGLTCMPYVDGCVQNPQEFHSMDKDKLTPEEQSKIQIWAYPTWEATHYLIGKWADVKHSFEELKERAIKRFIETERAKLRKEMRTTKRELEDIEATAIERFN